MDPLAVRNRNADVPRLVPFLTSGRPRFTVALIGNPNSGKTTLFNALTGLRQKVANYPGVTIERKTGRWQTDRADYELIDLPGTYSLIPHSPDEAIATDLLRGEGTDAAPDAVICIVDVNNLSRHLYLAGQVIELGRPVVIALTMVDEARRRGAKVKSARLSSQLGVPVIEVVATEGIGLDRLAAALDSALAGPWIAPKRGYRLPPALERRIAKAIPQAEANESQVLSCVAGQHTRACTEKLEQVAHAVRADLGVDEETVRRFIIEGRYRWQRDLSRMALRRNGSRVADWTRRLDAVFLHPALGFAILLAILALMFQAVFRWAAVPMDFLGTVTGTWLPSWTARILGPGPLRSLVNDGVLAGVGSVVTFLPQILILFAFLTVLEDSGYMARAAFILDRIMFKVGLSGRSFIPLLSSFACAIPGIMATRTVPHPRDRLTTILVAPLMTCSARLVVYTLLIAAFVPDLPIWGPLRLQGVTLLSLYVLGIVAAAGVAALFRKTILRGPTPPLLLELPAYRRPRLRTLALSLLERTRLFLTTAGTIIFAASIVLWALFTYPRNSEVERRFVAERQTILQQPDATVRAASLTALDHRAAAERLEHSAAGSIGRVIEPTLRPLGFDWKIAIGIMGSLAAREVFVSTMGIVYGVGSDGNDRGLIDRLKADRNPRTGATVWTPLVAITLMVFYAFALQCVSTMAVMRRETNSWKWPAFAFVYMGVLAYAAALLTRQVWQYFS
ncbi:MAG: ferrous iron transport protein B [Candidatus Zixiibacteriota bacterium]